MDVAQTDARVGAAAATGYSTVRAVRSESISGDATDVTTAGRGPKKGRRCAGVGKIAATCFVFGVVGKQHRYKSGQWNGEGGESGDQRRFTRRAGEPYKQALKKHTRCKATPLNKLPRRM